MGWKSVGALADPSGLRLVARRAWLVALVLLLPLLAACGSGSGGQSIAWREEPTVPPPTEVPATPEAPVADDAGGGASAAPVMLTDGDLARYRPNELGRIPILMYHAFTTREGPYDDWTRNPASFRADLEWLYERDFYVVPLADLINNEIEAPPGKHPVVLTFDDASSGQFRLLKGDDGSWAPDPDTAVGVMEAFYAEHPDFGRGGFFAVLPYNCFSYDGEETTCEERLTWLDEHGYELGNHSWGHQNLAEVSDETLIAQVAKTKIWMDERVTGDGNLGNVLVLPYGNFPGSDRQLQMLREGFVFEGQQVYLAAMVGVHGGPSPSPSSGDWTRWKISRFNTDPATWEYWQDQIDAGAITLYTSDGNPGTVTIPDPVPADVASQLDLEWASSYGMQVIRYEAVSGPVADSATPSASPPPPDDAWPDVAPPASPSAWPDASPPARAAARRPVTS